MNKSYYQAKIKSTGVAYLFWFVLGAHYAYLGKWGLQILYWITLGGFGIWAIIDLFIMSSKVEKVNMPIFNEIDKIEKDEKHEERMNQMQQMHQMQQMSANKE